MDKDGLMMLYYFTDLDILVFIVLTVFLEFLILQSNVLFF